MEHGFYHPDRGYWQTNGTVSQQIRDGYPEGTVELTLKPSMHHTLVEGEWVFVAPVIDPAEVVAERDRRLTILASGYTLAERETWHAQVAEANAFKSDPMAATPMLSPLAAARGMTVQEMADRVLANGTAFSSGAGAILGAATALIALDPIPVDFAADGYWP